VRKKNLGGGRIGDGVNVDETRPEKPRYVVGGRDGQVGVLAQIRGAKDEEWRLHEISFQEIVGR
jgi:hypothetical protein